MIEEGKPRLQIVDYLFQEYDIPTEVTAIKNAWQQQKPHDASKTWTQKEKQQFLEDHYDEICRLHANPDYTVIDIISYLFENYGFKIVKSTLYELFKKPEQSATTTRLRPDAGNSVAIAGEASEIQAGNLSTDGLNEVEDAMADITRNSNTILPIREKTPHSLQSTNASVFNPLRPCFHDESDDEHDESDL